MTSTWQSLDPEFEAKVRERFLRQAFMQHLGAQMTAVAPGRCEIRAPYRADLTQQHGFFHAGVSGSIADSASGYAAFTLMPTQSSVLTVEYKLNLVAPAMGQWLVARAEVLRNGKTLKVCRADVFGVKDGAETLCATMLSTIMTMFDRKDAAR